MAIGEGHLGVPITSGSHHRLSSRKFRLGPDGVRWVVCTAALGVLDVDACETPKRTRSLSGNLDRGESRCGIGVLGELGNGGGVA